MPELQARLSKKHDADIISAFKNVANHSNRLRELVRLGLEYEAQKRIGTPILKKITRQDEAQIEKIEEKPIIFRTTDSITVHTPNVIVENILAGFD